MWWTKNTNQEGDPIEIIAVLLGAGGHAQTLMGTLTSVVRTTPHRGTTLFVVIVRLF
jgi:hypothetical protein